MDNVLLVTCDLHHEIVGRRTVHGYQTSGVTVENSTIKISLWLS